MHHNEDAYPEPDVFKPERFFVNGKLNEDKSTDSFAFGFGRYFDIFFFHFIPSLTLFVRRVCPGRYNADSSVWAAMVSILCAFKITKARGEQGEELEFEPSFSYGVTT